jgi:hypothetical protein
MLVVIDRLKMHQGFLCFTAQTAFIAVISTSSFVTVVETSSFVAVEPLVT